MKLRGIYLQDTKCALRWVKYLYEKHGLGTVDNLEAVLSVGVEFKKLIELLTNQTIQDDKIPLNKALSVDGIGTTNSNSLKNTTRKGLHLPTRRATSYISSISPNHNILVKILFFLKSELGLPLKNVTASDLANRNHGTIVKVVWDLFSIFVLEEINNIVDEGM